MKALDLYQKRYNYEIEFFKEGRINPNIYKPIICVKEVSLSPYFRHGCLSVRKFFWEIHKAFAKVFYFYFLISIYIYIAYFWVKTFLKYFKGEQNSFIPAEQLFWREFFYHLSYKNEKFDQIDGNIMSFKIPWDWNRNSLFSKWEEVNT